MIAFSHSSSCARRIRQTREILHFDLFSECRTKEISGADGAPLAPFIFR
jgi:hypothetical protein